MLRAGDDCLLSGNIKTARELACRSGIISTFHCTMYKQLRTTKNSLVEHAVAQACHNLCTTCHMIADTVMDSTPSSNSRMCPGHLCCCTQHSSRVSELLQPSFCFKHLIVHIFRAAFSIDVGWQIVWTSRHDSHTVHLHLE